MTLDELREIYGWEVLAEVTSALNLELKDRYEADDKELTAILDAADKHVTSTTSTTSRTSGKLPKPAKSAPKKSGSKDLQAQALTRRQQAQGKAQGQLVSAQEGVSKATLATAKNQGQELATLHTRTVAETYLKGTAKGLGELAQLIGGMGTPLLDLQAQAYLEDESGQIKEEIRFLYCEGTDPAELAQEFDLDPAEIESWIETEGWEVDETASPLLGGLAAEFNLLSPSAA